MLSIIDTKSTGISVLFTSMLVNGRTNRGQTRAVHINDGEHLAFLAAHLHTFLARLEAVHRHRFIRKIHREVMVNVGTRLRLAEERGTDAASRSWSFTLRIFTKKSFHRFSS